MSSKPAGSAVRTRRPGASASSASAIPGAQPAAAAADQHVGRRHARLRRLRGDLEPDRALPGDHLRMVEGRDQASARAPPPARRAERVAVLGGAVVEHHLGAVARASPSIFTAGASEGIRITAGAPCAAAAQATPWAWLPDE